MRRTTRTAKTRVESTRTFGAVAARNRMVDGKRVHTGLGTFSMRTNGSVWRKNNTNRGWSKYFNTGDMFVKAYRDRTFNL